MSTQIITAQYNNIPVFFLSDAFINATDIAKQFNKIPKDYLKTDRTKEYIDAVRKNILTEENQIVKVVQGGNPKHQGTWLHPKLAIDFARWLSADFAVWCDLQIEKILHPAPYGLKTLPEPPTITKAQEGILFNRVKTISSGSGKIRAELWSRFQNHFKLSSYKALPTDAFDDAMEYLDLKEQEYSQGVEMLWISRTELNEMVEKQHKALPAPAPLEGDLLHTPQHNKLSFDLAPLRAGETRRWLITQLATDAAMFHPLAPDQQVLTQQEAINALQQDYIVIKKSEVLGRLEA